jgi:hypothetical protein
MSDDGDRESMRLRQAYAGKMPWRRRGPYLAERPAATIMLTKTR